jgi:Integrase core domain
MCSVSLNISGWNELNAPGNLCADLRLTLARRGCACRSSILLPGCGHALPRCRYRKLNSAILMVQSAEERLGNDAANGFDRPPNRRVLAQRQVRASFIVILAVRYKRVRGFWSCPVLTAHRLSALVSACPAGSGTTPGGFSCGQGEAAPRSVSLFDGKARFFVPAHGRATSRASLFRQPRRPNAGCSSHHPWSRPDRAPAAPPTDNVFIERLWRSVKYEEVYLRAYDTVSEDRSSIARCLDFYNSRRPHSS